MIRSFTHKGLEAFFYRGTKRRIRPEHALRLEAILDRLDAAHTLQDMNYPGADLHPLTGPWAGYWAVRVSGNWRVIFRFVEGHAEAVNYLDYH